MNDLGYYIAKNYNIEIFRNEAGNGYVVQHPELRGCITAAKSIRRAIESLQEAQCQWLISALEEGYPVPEPESDCHFFRYRDCSGSIEYLEKDNCFHGKIINIKSLVSYESRTIEGLAEEFIEAVDDYLDDC